MASMDRRRRFYPSPQGLGNNGADRPSVLHGAPSAHEQVAVSALKQLHTGGGMDEETCASREIGKAVNGITHSSDSAVGGDGDEPQGRSENAGPEPRPVLRWQQQRPRSILPARRRVYIQQARDVLMGNGPAVAQAWNRRPEEARSLETGSGWQPRALGFPSNARKAPTTHPLSHNSGGDRVCNFSSEPVPRSSRPPVGIGSSVDNCAKDAVQEWKGGEQHNLRMSQRQEQAPHSGLLNNQNQSIAPKKGFRPFQHAKGLKIGRFVRMQVAGHHMHPGKPLPTVENRLATSTRSVPMKSRHHISQPALQRRHPQLSATRKDQYQGPTLRQPRLPIQVMQCHPGHAIQASAAESEDSLLPIEETVLWEAVREALQAAGRYRDAHLRFWSNRIVNADIEAMVKRRANPLSKTKTAAVNFSRLLIQEVMALEDIVRTHQSQSRNPRAKSGSSNGLRSTTAPPAEAVEVESVVNRRQNVDHACKRLHNEKTSLLPSRPLSQSQLDPLRLHRQGPARYVQPILRGKTACLDSAKTFCDKIHHRQNDSSSGKVPESVQQSNHLRRISGTASSMPRAQKSQQLTQVPQEQISVRQDGALVNAAAALFMAQAYNKLNPQRPRASTIPSDPGHRRPIDSRGIHAASQSSVAPSQPSSSRPTSFQAGGQGSQLQKVQRQTGLQKPPSSEMAGSSQGKHSTNNSIRHQRPLQTNCLPAGTAGGKGSYGPGSSTQQGCASQVQQHHPSSGFKSSEVQHQYWRNQKLQPSDASAPVRKPFAGSSQPEARVAVPAQTSKKTKSSKEDVIFELEELTSLFHIKIEEAARILGVCTTVVKRQCRLHGIERWPARKLQSILTQIQALEKQPDSMEVVKRWQQMGGPWADITQEEEALVARMYQLIYEKHAIIRSEVPTEYKIPTSNQKKRILGSSAAASAGQDGTAQH